MDDHTGQRLRLAADKARESTEERDRLIVEAFQASASLAEVARAVSMGHLDVRLIVLKASRGRG